MIAFSVIKKWLLSMGMILVFICNSLYADASVQSPKFSVIAFYTAKHDQAHIDYVHEANRWFSKMAIRYNFSYDSTSNWSRMTPQFLSHYQVVIFLDTRIEEPTQRKVFQHYMEGGGGWLGFHFSAFALSPSDYPQNWDWYHNEFLGSGEYVGNTWKPTSAILRVEHPRHRTSRQLPHVFTSAPNEWYKWSNDLRTNKNIEILLSIDSASFPLGTGPKPNEIWHSGYYPVAWTNRQYKMVYINMGHNDIDYSAKVPRELSSTFGSEIENQFIINSLFYAAGR